MAVASFPVAPRGIAVELFLNNTWVDVTSDVRSAAGINITRGRPNEASAAQPSTCTMTFDNRSGNYSPRNPLGVYYGQIGRNTLVRVSVRLAKDTFTRTVANDWGTADTGDAWSSSGAGGTVFNSDFQVASGVGTHSVPVANAYRFTYIPGKVFRDVDVFVTVSLPFTTVLGAAVEPACIILRGRSITDYYLMVVSIGTAGAVTVSIRHYDGTVLAAATSTGLTHSSTQSLRARFQAEGQTLRAKVWAAAATEPYRWQAVVNDTRIPGSGWVGVRSGVVVGNTNTLPVVFSYSNFSIRSPRFFGEIVSWPQQWDIAGADVTSPAEAAGVTRRLGQGQSVVLSTLYSGITSLSPPAVAYWPCEDGPSSATILSASGGPAMSVSDTSSTGTKFAAYGAIISSMPIPTVGASTWTGPIPYYAGTGFVQVRFIMNVSSPPTDNTPLITFLVTGSAYAWRLKYYTGGGLGLQAFDSFSSPLDTGAVGFGVDGKNLMVSIELSQSGSNVNWAFRTLEAGAQVGLSWSGTLSGYTISEAYQVQVSEFKTLTSVNIGHIYVQKEVTNLFQLGAQLAGYAGEAAGTRLQRLCGQQAIPLTVIGDVLGGGLTNTTAIGPQQVDTFLNLANDCSNTDMGTLTEPKGTNGLLYRTRASLYLQSPTATINYGGGQIAPPFDPVDDDQLTRNTVTVTRRDGSSATAALLTGRMSTLDSSLGGVGLYDTGLTLNVASDDQLPDIAGWLLNLGTVDDARYPRVRVDLANPNVVKDPALSAAILDLSIDDRFIITNPKIGQTPNTISQIVRGYSEHISTFEHSITFNAAPEAPYATLALDAGCKLDTSGSTLAAGVTSSATTLSVATPTGALWTTSSGQMPIRITAAGEVMSVTSISGSSSPQVFTVTRSVNGISKAQTVNTVISLSTPYPIPL